jgi:phosphoribosylanthranilate isomerase
VKTIGRITVQNHSAIPSSRRFKAPLWDAIILDSIDTDTGQRGATGLIHDWSISAKIVQQSSIPVILAGGLTPKNVANAIRTVRPHAVDAHTGLEDEDGSRNLRKIEQFATIAREAFQAYVFSNIP